MQVDGPGERRDPRERRRHGARAALDEDPRAHEPERDRRGERQREGERAAADREAILAGRLRDLDLVAEPRRLPDRAAEAAEDAAHRGVEGEGDRVEREDPDEDGAHAVDEADPLPEREVPAVPEIEAREAEERRCVEHGEGDGLGDPADARVAVRLRVQHAEEAEARPEGGFRHDDRRRGRRRAEGARSTG